MRRAMTLLALLAMLAPVPAAAQSANYSLSMEKLRKLVEVQRTLTALNATRPELFERLDGEMATKAKKKGTALTATERAAVLDRYSEIKSVFTRAKWTSRDWVLTGEAMGYAFLAHEVKKGRLSPKSVPAPRTPEQKANVALVEKNQTEWRKIQQELERLSEELE